MFRNHTLPLVLTLALGASAAWPQDRRPRIDVEQYTIDAEVSPAAQSLTAKASVRFLPLDDNITSPVFELNNALTVSRVVDDKGKQIPASRNQQDFSVRLTFDQPLVKGQAVTITFYYEGKLSGQEDSPVYGIKFAAIHPDFAFLTYPARWFPVSGYTTDRFSADLSVTVPPGYTVLGSGNDSKETAGDKTRYHLKFERPSFPGSIAIVKGPPARVATEGVTTSLYFRSPETDMAQLYGEQPAVMALLPFLTGALDKTAVLLPTPSATSAGEAPRLKLLIPGDLKS